MKGLYYHNFMLYKYIKYVNFPWIIVGDVNTRTANVPNFNNTIYLNSFRNTLN